MEVAIGCAVAVISEATAYPGASRLEVLTCWKALFRSTSFQVFPPFCFITMSLNVCMAGNGASIGEAIDVVVRVCKDIVDGEVIETGFFVRSGGLI